MNDWWWVVIEWGALGILFAWLLRRIWKKGGKQ